MSDQERDIWKAAYKVYDKYYDREITTGMLPRMAEELRDAYVKHGENPLMIHLGVALINYFSEKAKENALNEAAEQVRMEGV